MPTETELARLLDEAARPTLEAIRRDRAAVPERIAKMLDLLEQELFSPSLTVQTWKRACGVGDNSISIEIHKWLGLSPRAYIASHRLATAARLLSDTGLKVWQVGELVGYSSLGVFSKAFCHAVGQRPIAYRQQQRAPHAPAPPSFSGRELRAALTGTLPEDRVAALLDTLLEHYPSLEERLGEASAPPSAAP